PKDDCRYLQNERLGSCWQVAPGRNASARDSSCCLSSSLPCIPKQDHESPKQVKHSFDRADLWVLLVNGLLCVPYNHLMNGRPQSNEAAPYYFAYIDQVPGDNPMAVLEIQLDECLELLSTISDDKSLYRYARDKW